MPLSAYTASVVVLLFVQSKHREMINLFTYHEYRGFFTIYKCLCLL